MTLKRRAIGSNGQLLLDNSIVVAKRVRKFHRRRELTNIKLALS